jgi:hypothetical protein
MLFELFNQRGLITLLHGTAMMQPLMVRAR